MQNWSTRLLVQGLENNTKELVCNLDYAVKQHSLDQNSLLWGLLEEEAKFLNGGRKITSNAVLKISTMKL